MVQCMKLALGKDNRDIFISWYESHKFIFLNAINLYKCKVNPDWGWPDLLQYYKEGEIVNQELENVRGELLGKFPNSPC